MSVDSAVKLVPGGDNLVKGVQCYEPFGGIALKITLFSLLYFLIAHCLLCFLCMFIFRKAMHSPNILDLN